MRTERIKSGRSVFSAEDYQHALAQLDIIHAASGVVYRITNADRREPADTKRLKDAERRLNEVTASLISWFKHKQVGQ